MMVDDKDCFERVRPGDESRYSGFQNCSHVFLFARTEKKIIEKYSRRAIVMMQMRFDGQFGFPGGIVEEGEAPFLAANRECFEENSYNPNLTSDDILFIYVNEKHRCLFHFFAKELSEDELEDVIKNTCNARDYHTETLGSIIIPLYTMSDGFRGFPAFLNNMFIGNAKNQLLEALVALKILSQDEVNTAVAVKNPNHTVLLDD